MAGRKTLQKHVWRARSLLLSADGLGNHAVMRATGVSKTSIWCWQERFAQEDIAPLGLEVAARMVTLTQRELDDDTIVASAGTMRLVLTGCTTRAVLTRPWGGERPRNSPWRRSCRPPN